MFKRRHPYLFFILVFTSIVSISWVMLTVAVGVGGPKEAKKGESVGIVEIRGMILDPKKITAQLKAFRDDDNIRAVVLRVDSPGGAVGPSQEIYMEVRRTIEIKPVIASMGAIAASGGYYVAAAADGIVANPGTITGSIGVIMELTNFEALFEKIGIYSDVVKSGEYKDIGSPFRPVSDKEEQLLQQFVDSVHRQFVSDVAAGRNMPEEEVHPLADGMIFSGEYAKNAGLVDRLGNLNDAVAWAGEKAGIKGEIVRIYPPEEKLSLVRKMLEMTASEIESMVHRIHSGTVSGGYLYDPSAGVRDSR
ncbi:MAG: signal peptide peptidase SppA [Desulfosalsimonadaceae bacterium]